MAMLFKLLAPIAPYLAAAVLMLGAMFYVSTLRHDLAAATQRNAVLLQLDQANAAAIADDKAQQVKWNASLDALDAQTLETGNKTGQLEGAIAAAATADDGPVAAVLVQALDGLRALQGDAP